MPVHCEGKTIIPTLVALRAAVKSPVRVVVCYDSDDDSTLQYLTDSSLDGLEIVAVKNKGRGVHGAVVAGFIFDRSPAVIMYPADDTANTDIVGTLIERFHQGAGIVVPSRFMRGAWSVASG